MIMVGARVVVVVVVVVVMAISVMTEVKLAWNLCFVTATSLVKRISIELSVELTADGTVWPDLTHNTAELVQLPS